MTSLTTPSSAIGTPATPFALRGVDGTTHSLASARGPSGVVVMFICNHCPYVKHVQQELAALGREYGKRGAAVVAISSNDVANYPDDAPDKMKLEKERAGYTFPYLFDESQDVAKAYQAACTPDFFVFDGDRKLVYRGQMDESRPGNGVPVTAKDLRAALDAVLASREVPADQKPSIGCNIKWRAGNEPRVQARPK